MKSMKISHVSYQIIGFLVFRFMEVKTEVNDFRSQIFVIYVDDHKLEAVCKISAFYLNY